jgi:hypothetical protein
MSMATSRILWAMAHWATNSLTFDRGERQPTGILRRNERFGLRRCPLGGGRLSAGLSTLQGDDDVAGMGPEDVDGDVTDPGDGASGDSTLGHSAGENVGPPASPGGTNGLADGRDAPSTIAMNVGPAPGGQRTRNDGGGRWRCERGFV